MKCWWLKETKATDTTMTKDTANTRWRVFEVSEKVWNGQPGATGARVLGAVMDAHVKSPAPVPKLVFNVEFTDYELSHVMGLKHNRENYAVQAFRDALVSEILQTVSYSEQRKSGGKKWGPAIRGRVTADAGKLGPVLARYFQEPPPDKTGEFLTKISSRIAELDQRDEYQDDIRAEELRTLLSALEQEAC